MKPLQDVEEEPVFVTDHGLMADGSLSHVGSVTKQHTGRVAAGTVLKSASDVTSSPYPETRRAGWPKAIHASPIF